MGVDDSSADAPRKSLHWCSDPIAEWMIVRGLHYPSGEVFLSELCRHLVAAGIPLWRVVANYRALHPQVFGRTIAWERGCDCTTVQERYHGIEKSPEYLNSPVKAIHDGAGAVRRRLEGDDAVLDYPILAELKAQGATDYVIMPVLYSTGRVNFISWTTDEPGGFSREHLERLNDLLPVIALLGELMGTRRVGRDLLNVYLGKDAARRVLSGEIKRGTGRTIRAVLWHCDLEGFTALSDRTSPDELITLLDDYFDSMAGPVEARGGEVLKFIGDAILAMFWLESQDPCDVAAHALDAAVEATRNLAALNARRSEAGQEPLSAKIALHVGDVMYGNVGAADRLDFTVIGPAVNLLARVEPLCADLREPVLATADFARLCPGRMASRGLHHLKGLSEPAEVFALAERADARAPEPKGMSGHLRSATIR